MIQNSSANVKVSHSNINKLKSATKISREVILRLSSDTVGANVLYKLLLFDKKEYEKVHNERVRKMQISKII